MEYKSISHLKYAMAGIKHGDSLIIPQKHICKIFQSESPNTLSFNQPLLDKKKFKHWAEENFQVEVTLTNYPINEPDLKITFIPMGK
jgi:hypothetical protein